MPDPIGRESLEGMLKLVAYELKEIRKMSMI